MIEALIKSPEKSGLFGQYIITKTDSKTGKILQTIEGKNLIMLGNNTGGSLILEALARAINGDPYTSFIGGINYVAIGTGTTAPTVGDTQLTSESIRVIASFASVASNILTVQGFFPDTVLPNATYNEIGTFVDGNPAINSGHIFNHALFGTAYTKSSGEDTTIQLTFTLTLN